MKDIIVVDDEKDIRTILSTILEDEGYQVRAVPNSQELFETLKGRIPNIIFLDIWLKNSDLDGIETLHKLVQHFPDIDVIMISGHGNIQTAVHAMHIGAHSFMEKPIKTEYLLLTLERLIKIRKIKSLEAQKQTNCAADIKNPIFLQGNSLVINQVRSIAAKQFDKDSRVMLSGDVGTGKYDLARYIHENSTRHCEEFVALRASFKMDAASLEKELFGFYSTDNPSFVGKKGLLEKAHMGTIYLEKIDLYPHSTQKKLVKFLADKKFMRFMSQDKGVYADVRVITSLSMPLKSALQNNLLLNDLYVRLGTVMIRMPSLKQRQDDIHMLATAYAQEICSKYNGVKISLAKDLLDFFQKHQWQKNLRELYLIIKSLIDDAYASNDHKPISCAALPEYLRGDHISSISIQQTLHKPLREAREIFERDYLLAQLTRFKGNISKTAQFVGMERSALHRKLRNLNIDNYRNVQIDCMK